MSVEGFPQCDCKAVSPDATDQEFLISVVQPSGIVALLPNWGCLGLHPIGNLMCRGAETFIRSCSLFGLGLAWVVLKHIGKVRRVLLSLDDSLWNHHGERAYWPARGRLEMQSF